MMVKYYSVNRAGHYYIQKYLAGKIIHYGTFKTIWEVEDAVSFLKDNDWSKEKFLEYYYGKKDDKYIKNTSNGKFLIQKYIDGHICSFGTFDTLEEAIRERDICVECGWDYDLIVEK